MERIGDFMWIQISNYLFMGSLLLLIVTFIAKGASSQGFTSLTGLGGTSGSATDLTMEHNQKKHFQFQDSLVGRIVKSYLFWISITGILISIVISKL
ncbi:MULTISPECIES: hypothetical protein [unclassified Paenibacillus]|uniref:hypothetical protein n=1 Tax=unclassified Paenibacillus TaxID=185978 RepID=UPI00070BC976|nr:MULTISPECIES: hypothetical protein [unclassified Paenibacillus]KQX51603.1 hypothetical protein ASD40_05760 [Paenibacillus sp. Root444D2]KRE40352.1 hypothetical protein ASG85_34635 [Paenibacillus sp. Soil724D2]